MVLFLICLMLSSQCVAQGEGKKGSDAFLFDSRVPLGQMTLIFQRSRIDGEWHQLGFEAKPIRVWICRLSWLLAMGLRCLLSSSALWKVWVWGRT